MSKKYEKLKTLLKELFQLDQPDLDFGLYRIMHAKSAEVSQFLDKDLLPQVKDAFALYKTADKAEIEKELAKVVAGIEAAGMDPEQSPKVAELRARLKGEAVDVGQLESEVYDHLFSFFRRYYSEGDFLSKRVYKPGVYAIPYEGEEVKLHWANADQYYIKTSEYLRDYAFRLPGNAGVPPASRDGQDLLGERGRDARAPRVHFRLVDAAEGEHGNVKAAAGKDRRFKLAETDTLAIEDGELIVRFTYQPDPAKQKELNAAAERTLLDTADPAFAAWIGALRATHRRADGTESENTRLRVHLDRYTARNTFDYFIHKDLGGFLRRELDFYIKNEVMHLDDIENESAPRVEQYLSKIKVIRRIAGKIIEFLAQLEDFQKKLWLKKKFVVETSWCIRMGVIPEEFYPEIAANEAQREEWVQLGFPGNPAPGNAAVSAARPAAKRSAGETPAFPGFTPETGTSPGEPKGWHSRGYLPHFDDEGLVQFVTFRLHDSVPADQIESWKNELRWAEGLAADSKEAVTLRKRIEEYEDAGKGACYLRDERVAEMVENALRHFDGTRYRLLEWCIMPNHVHVLVERLPGHGLSEIVHSWKSFTAHEANAILGRTGDFWMPDYFDRFIRNDQHYETVVDYIRENPVKAGLVASPEEWRWSSAGTARTAPVSGAGPSGRDARVPSVAFLKTHPTLMVDTRHFDIDFTARLLDGLGDVDDQTDGVLFHSENFQALALMQARYREQVKCIYIDPPYNTGSDGFAYKDSYQHSSWAQMVFDRLSQGHLLVSQSGVQFISCDDNEQARLTNIAECIFGNGPQRTLVWRARNFTDTRSLDGVSADHEYVLFFGKNHGARLRGKGKDFGKYANPDRDPRGDWTSCSLLGKATAADRPNLHYEFEDPATGNVFSPPPSTGWICAKSTMEDHIREKRILWPRKRGGRPRVKVYRQDLKSDFMGFPSIIDGVYTSHGTVELSSMFGAKVMAFPKPAHMIASLIEQGAPDSADAALDYFAGSGTTGHAVINLNREDGGQRKFILVEMGDHFDTVLLPRLKKVSFSPEWKDGKPKRLATPEEAERSPRILKVARLESYEDVLNNLEMKRSEVQQSLLDGLESRRDARAPGFREDYLLHYMLDVETRGSQSLLNAQAFADPTAYKLKVKRPGSDESREVNVDLLETFNWLIGLTVQHIAVPQTFSATFERDSEKRLRLKGRLKQEADGPYWFRTVTGTTLDGRKTLVIWRNCPGNAGVPPARGDGQDVRAPSVEEDNLVLDEWFTRQGYSSKDSEFDLIYVNGGNNLENLKTPDDRWKVRLIEEDFHRLMFEDVS